MRLFEWLNYIPGIDKWGKRSYAFFLLFLLASYFAYVRVAVVHYVGHDNLLTIFSRAMLFGAFLLSAICLGLSNLGKKRCNKQLWCMFCVGLLLLFYCSILGLNRGNLPAIILIQASFMGMMLMYFIEGSGGERFAKTMDVFLIFFWIMAIIVFLTKDVIHGGEFTETGVEVVMGERHTRSLGYIMKQYLNAMPLFFTLGVFLRRKMSAILRILYLATIIPHIYLLIYVFKFRTGMWVVVMTMMLTMWNSIKSKKVVGAIIGVLVLAIGAILYTGKDADLFRERVEASMSGRGLTGMLQDARAREFGIMMREFSLVEKIFGRGFGGHYDASEMFWQGYEWSTIHMGFFIGMLYGGIFFLIWLYWLFIKASLRQLHPLERRDGFLVACKIYVFVELVHLSFCPFAFLYSLSFPYSVTFLAIGALWSPKYTGCMNNHIVLH